jgi:hypothetical protein
VLLRTLRLLGIKTCELTEELGGWLVNGVNITDYRVDTWSVVIDIIKNVHLLLKKLFCKVENFQLR